MDETPGMPPTPPEAPAPPPPPVPSGMPAPASSGRPGPENDTSKLLAAFGYVVGIVAIIAILMDPYKNEKFVKFHAWQAIGLWVVWVALGIVFGILGSIFWPIGLLSPIAYLALFIYCIYLAVKAYGGQYVEVPGLYGVIKGQIGE